MSERRATPVCVSADATGGNPFDAGAFVGRTLALRVGPTFEVLRSNAHTVTVRMMPHTFDAGDYYSPDTSGVPSPHFHAIEHIELDTFWRWIASGAIVLETSTSQAETEQESKADERQVKYSPVRRFSVTG